MTDRLVDTQTGTTASPAISVDLASLVSLGDVEEAARGILPKMVYEATSGGAADEITLRWNRDALDAIKLRPRMLVDVGNVQTQITLLGRKMPLPILLAPTAYQRLVHPEGEAAAARGAGMGGVTYIVSTSSNTSIEEIAAAATGPLWFQLYVQSDRKFTEELVHRVQSAGCEALVVTVDTPVLGARNRHRRAGFKLPAGMQTPHVGDFLSGLRVATDAKRESITWKDIEWLRSIAKVPVLLKGILDPEDAEIAVKAGAAAIVVSNHGGRNLDTVPATVTALPHVARRVGGRIPVLMDGGVRRGTDVVKALALGASAVLIGRPYMYGLAVGGSAGVAKVIAILREELEMALALTGRPSVGSIDRSVIWDY